MRNVRFSRGFRADFRAEFRVAKCSKIWVAAAAARLGARKVGAPGLMGVAWAKPRALKCFSVPLATVFNEISELSLISPCVACTVIWALCIVRKRQILRFADSDLSLILHQDE